MLKEVLVASTVGLATALSSSSADVPAAPAAPLDASAAEFVADDHVQQLTAGVNVFIDPAEKVHGPGRRSVLLVVGIERTLKAAAEGSLDERAYIEVPVSGVTNLDQWVAITPNLRVAALGGAATTQLAEPSKGTPAKVTRLATEADGLWLQGSGDKVMLNPNCTVDILPPPWNGAETVDEHLNLIDAAS